MNVLKSMTLILMAGLLFSSCKKNENNSPAPEQHLTAPPPEAFAAARKEALGNQMQHFTFQVGNNSGMIVFTSKNGAKVRINPNSLTLNNQSVTGKINIDFLELYQSGQMLVTNKVTMGLDDNGHLLPIISGGAFYIQAFQNGQPLDSSAQISMAVPGRLTGGIDYDMKLWKGKTDDQGNLTWKKAKINPAGRDGLQTNDSSYYPVFSQFGWTNIDRFATYNGPKTKMEVGVPGGFSDSNSVVYLKYKGEPNALALLDRYENGLFTEHYGWIPVGEECHIIFVSARSDGKWLIGIKSVAIEDGKIYHFTENDVQIVANDEAVIQMINDLP